LEVSEIHTSLVAVAKCKRCFRKVRIQYLKGGLCAACRRELGYK